MTAADLLTAGHADHWFRAILARVEALAAPAPAAGSAAVVLYSIADLAAVCRVDTGTVRRWLKSGKTNHQGERIYLKAFYFTSEARIPWPALLAYERGEDFDLAALPAPRPPEPAPAPPAGAVLRLAS